MEYLGPQVFGLTLSPKRNAQSNWDVAALGGRLAMPGGMRTAGIGGRITGMGADLAIVDDPVKNAEEAHSDVYREKSWDWFLSTLYTRLEPGGAMIVIMTRWHEDDIVGKLLTEGIESEDENEVWDVVNFPALAEEEDTLGRLPGEALFPERYPESRLLQIQHRIGAYWFAALYQQRPAPLEGGMFRREWFLEFQPDYMNGVYVLLKGEKRLRYEIEECVHFATVDPAFSEKSSSDFTVINVWALTPNHDLLLLDVVRKQIEGDKIVNELRDVQAEYRLGRIYVEAYGGGKVIAQMARSAGLPVTELTVPGDKQIRALPLQTRMSTSNFFILRGAPWRNTLIAEYLMFPNGKYDDQVDTGAYAAQVVTTQGTGRVTTIKRALR